MHSQTHQGPPTLGSLGNVRFTQAYRKKLESVPLARQRFREVAHDSKLDDELTERALLCLSELTGNAIRHAVDRRKRCQQILVESTVRGRWQHKLEISVWDIDGIRAPRIPNPATAATQLLDMPDDAVGGRGLLMVAMWSDEIGIDFQGRGKRIWCRWRL